MAGRGRRRTGRLSLLKCASLARNRTRRKGATQPRGGQRRLALHQKPRQGGAPGWPLAQALVSPLPYTLGMPGVSQLRVPFRTQGGRAVGPPPHWNPIPSLTSLEPAYQSTNRWGCSRPGDVTWNCFHVSSFLLESLPLLSAPHPRPGKSQTLMGEPWL